MKQITIAEFQTLIRKCLACPASFSNKSIVLWNADDAPTGIAHRIIKEGCREYNKNNPEQQVWFTMRDITNADDDFSKIETCEVEYIDGKPVVNGPYTRGILFANYPLPSDYNSWVNFVRNRKNAIGSLSKDWVLIACTDEKLFPVKEAMFSGNSDVYSIHPSIKEWEAWAAQYYSQGLIKPICEYIKAKGQTVSFDDWQRIMNNLELKMVNNGYKTLGAVPKQSVLLLSGVVPYFHAEDFWDFVQTHV